MSYEQKAPRLLEEVGELSLSVFANQIGLLYTCKHTRENTVGEFGKDLYWDS
jgi:hypothetical protein